MVRTGKAVALVLSAVLLFTGVLLLVLPHFSAERAENARSYECLWEDGSRTTESYASVAAAFSSLSEDEILLFRDGKRGNLVVGESFSRICRILKEGSLAELLSLDLAPLSGAERTALLSVYADVIFYDGDSFVLEGDRVVRTERSKAETVDLVSGELPIGYLAETGAEKLVLRADAQPTAAALRDSSIDSVEAHAPYFFRDGGIYLDTAGGTRLVAALPALAEFTAADVDFFDEGALSSCTALASLSLPFVGSSRDRAGEEFVPYFGHIFGEDGSGRYSIPDSLERVCVRGGTVGAHAFYGCGEVEQIDLCGVFWQNIHRDAFADCLSLQILHTRRRSLDLPGTFVRAAAECGCYLYTRVG